MSIRKSFGCLGIILSLLTFAFAQESYLPAQVRDVSDRAYEPAVIELLHKAKESIVISMYDISLGASERNPIAFLLQDLIEARRRGVEVTIYLNTNFREIDQEPHQLIRSLKKLRDNYSLIQVKFFHSKDAWIELADLPRETFSINSNLISDWRISQRLKFLLLIKALLESQGQNLNSISQQEIARRFHIHPWTVGEAFKELKKYEKGA